jgi:hypothetical protein
MQAWEDGGYSDDMTAASVCNEARLRIACPASAVFLQTIEPTFTLSRYWSYLRRCALAAPLLRLWPGFSSCWNYAYKLWGLRLQVTGAACLFLLLSPVCGHRAPVPGRATPNFVPPAT